MPRWQIKQTVDPTRGEAEITRWPQTLMETEDAHAHEWHVRVVGDAPLQGATITGWFKRSDEMTVILPGRVTGAQDTAVVVFDPSCYRAPGGLTAAIRVSYPDGTVITLAKAYFYVEQSGTDQIVDPENIVPSIDLLLAQIETMEAGIAQMVATTAQAKEATAQATAAGQYADAQGDRAEQATAQIDGMTVAGTQVDVSEPYRVTISTVNGVKHIQFFQPAAPASVITQLDPGLFGLYINDAGYLVLVHRTGETPPPLAINDKGELVYRLEG